MLKALELIGFKSFADKTRFEFPAGITVIVGPNGSGKSNIVDAIKWVLGEQSAKSLRGKDMADIIFKGAGSGGRRPMNTAEATIIIDNSEGRLAIDAPEVHVTRRVYRSGEGEYLINRQPCRLKDIRDLFRGTGVGTDAYSLIEQGKVDRLLQASPRERRAIFEEAAGISRFKAKKIEAQRRLERVQQNLVRLSDIVDEVESRLRSVRAQASKARRYREHSQRLQQLRTHVGRVDYKRLSAELAEVNRDIDQLSQQAASLSARGEALDSRGLELETEIESCGESLRRCEAQVGANREQIAARQAAVEHQRGRMAELQEATQQRRARIAAMTNRAGDLRERLQQVKAELAAAEARHAELTTHLDAESAALHEVAARIHQLRNDSEARKTQHFAALRKTQSLSNRASSLRSETEASETTATRRRAQLEEIADQQQAHAPELAQLAEREQKLAQTNAQRAAQVDTVRSKLASDRRLLAQEQRELSELQSRHRGASERAAILEDLENRQEGLAGGVKDVLARARQGEPLFAGVCGLVADLFQVDVEIAPLVDAALGRAAQHVVVEGDALIRAIESRSYRPPGRLGLVRLQDDYPPADDGDDWTGRDDVIGRADRFVQTATEHRALARHLLAKAWLVRDLQTALQLHQAGPAGRRLVTAAGEIVEPDGAIIAGPRGPAGGLISRRSELRALQAEIVELAASIESAAARVAELESEIESSDQTLQRRSGEQKQIESELSEVRAELRGAQERRQHLEKQHAVIADELRAAEARQAQAADELAHVQQQLSDTEAVVAELEAALARDGQQLDEADSEREERSQRVTAAKVEFAASRQKLESLGGQLSQCEDDQRERGRALRDAFAQLETAQRQHRESEASILASESELAELFLQKESLAAQAAEHLRRRSQIAAQRGEIIEESQSLRQQLRRAEEKLHKQELAAGEVKHQRDSLVDRLREDYGVEVADLEAASEQQEAEREKIEEEIADLRRKINRIGAVNMDALEELEELETRFLSLSGQHQDLQQAKEALERIISKINSDSRRLFIETLDAIRDNFQVLYRKAFGGGSADIALEEGVDILECGVEILATPPGKPSFNNSLLSGGERALTAVALLLAIFQFRPSPFCVLDEVDAPFDEANISRFIDVLRGFLGWTKFVIVTHSKKTMTAATTLYGVTMQESGVSKRVSVRFEDVSEDGHISAAAIERTRQEADESDAA